MNDRSTNYLAHLWRNQVQDVASARLALMIHSVLPGLIVFTASFIELVQGHPLVLFAPLASGKTSLVHLVLEPVMCGLVFFWAKHASVRAICHLTFWFLLAVAVVNAVPGMSGAKMTLQMQFIFFLPVIFGAYALTKVWSGLMSTLVISLYGVTCLAQPHPGTHLIDFMVLATVMVMFTPLITRARDTQWQLHHDASAHAECDPLTSLKNRKATLAFLSAAQHGGSAAGNQNATMLLIDVDHFKAVNDTHGHQVGDAVLQTIAGHMKNLTPAGGCAGRIGGDELTIVLPGTLLPEACQRADELVDTVSHCTFFGATGEPFHVTISVGVAEWPSARAGFKNLYAAADNGLYRAKSAGRNGWETPAAWLPTQRTNEAEVELEAQ